MRRGTRLGRVPSVTAMADLDALALALPETTRELSEDGRPAYKVGGKLYCCHRGARPDALDPETGERLTDVVMIRVPDLEVKELVLADDRDIFFTTPHFKGYPAVLARIRDLDRLPRDELADLVADAWLSRAPRRLARPWLAEHGDA